MKLSTAISFALALVAQTSLANTLLPNTAREEFQRLEQRADDAIWTVNVQYFDDAGLDRLVKLVDRPWKVDRKSRVAIIGIDSVAVYDQLIAAGLRVQLDARATDFVKQVNSVESLRTIPGFGCYRTVEETYDAATTLVAQNPAIAEWIDIGDTELKEANPANGYDMRVLRLTNRSVTGTPVSGRKPTLLVFGAIHAREYVTAETVTRFAERLVNGYGTDPNITWTLDQHEVHLVLIANPDGRKVAETQATRLQRKNRNPLFTCSTNNVLTGVDLNRNYSFDFGIGSTLAVCSETTNGGSAFSQNETAALSTYAQSIFPDQRSEASVTPG
jgi:carboxypeptidase T